MNVYQIITNQIIERLKQGDIPWCKPWATEQPKNLISKKVYQGLNHWLLYGMGESSYWLTFKQCQSLGGIVRKGSHGLPVIFWNIQKGTDKEGREKSIPFLRYYTVFNASQCEGIEYPKETRGNKEIIDCKVIIEGMPNKPEIKHNEPRAYYHKGQDFVNMPKIESFRDSESYYGTLFHELVHSTGHESRLNRVLSGTFGEKDYAREELIAEMGSAFLCAQAGIQKNLENNVGYIQGWLKALSNDEKLIVHAGGKAQKACDYILNLNKGNQDED